MKNIQLEAVIGLEVHAELATASKIFCSCPAVFGAAPNTHVCPVCMGFPGAMPSLNRHAVELAVRAGLALGCEIAEYSQTDRKQYFYPDLPKAYQISQDKMPLCKNGFLEISSQEGIKRIGIERIHIEEDAGKLLHTGSHTLLDCNRCGVPLIEIVSKPEMRTPQEASAYLRALRAILMTCGVSDCRMQEGSLRCDVNISLREAGSDVMGVRTEIKNLNSFAFVEKAISYEIKRQGDCLSKGQKLQAETRRFDADGGKTVMMRAKESAVDYRFLPEPDLLGIYISHEEIERIRAELPELPNARAIRLEKNFGLTDYDVAVLVSDPALADFFENGAGLTDHPKLLANLLLNDLLRFCTAEPFSSPVSASRMAELAQILGEGTINSSTAKKLLVRLAKSDFDLSLAVKQENLAQIRDEGTIRALVGEVMISDARAVADYRSGKTAAIKALQGKAMSRTAGRADPVLLERLLLEALSDTNMK